VLWGNPMRKTVKIGLIIGITIAFLTPVSLVIADDTEAPVISSIFYGPHAGVRTDPGFFLFQSCNVTDNVSVTDVRVNITGPTGFIPVNDSMSNVGGDEYYYQVDNVTLSGTYMFFIWAIDSSNNTVRSDLFYMLVFDNYLSYIHVDVNNTAGPWNGTEEFPLQFITDAIAVLAENGTIFIHEGIYQNTSVVLEKNMEFIGENQHSTILDGGGVNTSAVIEITGNYSILVSDLSIRNSMAGILLTAGGNATISSCTFTGCLGGGLVLAEYQDLSVFNCDFQDNVVGIRLTNSSYNQFYHNNFMNNTIHVSCYSNTINNLWDNGVTGNYWDDYRFLYPYAQIVPSTGTWDTPYMVNVSGNNVDNHPWVYPDGYIDTNPPLVTVLYPNGGEVLHGEVTIEWSASDDLTSDLDGTILLEYSNDNGGTWNDIASNQNNTGLYVWNTSLVPDGDLYLIGVTAIDEFLNIGTDRSDAVFSINNFATETPKITGPFQGGNGIPFNFSAVAFHPAGEQIYYKWDWGDGNETGFEGPFNSTVPMNMTYTWVNDGVYDIRVKARYSGGSESNWSAAHSMVVAEQINFSNVKLGTVYFKLFSFNRSFIFSDFLKQLGVVIILTSHEMELEGNATDVVKSVSFYAENQLQVESMEVIDDDGSDGFSCRMNLTRGVYTLNITAYDGNGTLVDKYSLTTVFFVRIGRYATPPIGSLGIIPRFRH
jgi:parallel beta-helix repeat protein